MAEYARVPPWGLSTTKTGIDGPTALAMGTTAWWRLAGSSSTSPAASSASAASGESAHPSAMTAARTERRSGSHTRSQEMRGPQWMIVRSPIPGTTAPAVWMATSIGVPWSSRRATSALAASMAADRFPYRRLSAATTSGSPSAGGRQSTWTTGRPWSAMASANSGRPRLTTSTSSGSWTVLNGTTPWCVTHDATSLYSVISRAAARSAASAS